MKPVLTFLLVTGMLWVQAQDSTFYKKCFFKVAAYTVSGHKITGFLPYLTDTALGIADDKHRLLPHPVANLTATNLNYTQLEMVTIHRKGAGGRGMLIGGIVGAVTGAVTGLLDGNDGDDNSGWCIFCMTAGQKAVGLGVAGGTTGALIGALIGSLSRKKFIIGGQKPAFDKMRLSILEKLNRMPLE